MDHVLCLNGSGPLYNFQERSQRRKGHPINGGDAAAKVVVSLVTPSRMRIGVMFSSLVPLQLPSRMQTHLWYILPNEVKSESLLIHGKPEVDWEVDTTTNYPKLKFNISHTDSLIACGVTVNVPVGIDVEDKTRKLRHNVISLAKRFYSSQEVKFLSSIADMEAESKEFIKLWTLKEAYVKALGKGFSASPFNTFSIIRSEAANYSLCGQAEGWKFRLLELAASSH
ncbi:hypothetical protein HID58_019453 [Brassica napus]|uniref:holo-[acyl-carrier-protein] synthase n=1 Tax=Brassica napus TaxID=3708 RepID=A0ABQ8DCW4_BRANA|nr:hypothetical protein HID58_019453 [Brassica napus]